MDVYDSLTNPRSYRKIMTPLNAFTVMTKEMKEKFDLEILTNFIKLMGPAI